MASQPQRRYSVDDYFAVEEVSVVKMALERGRPDTATNPVLLIEVLSPATREYDRGEKFALHKTIPTLREYLLIDEARPAVEQFTKSKSAAWRARSHADVTDVLSVSSVAVRIALTDLYRGVLPAGRGRRPPHRRRV